MVDERIKKIAIGDPEIADVRAISSYEILINGKSGGSTSLIIWTTTDKIERKVIVSEIDSDRIYKELKELLSGIGGVKIKTQSGKVILDGEVSNDRDLPVVEDLLRRYKGMIMNYIKLPVQMIKINARVVEISTSDDSQIGVDWQKKFEFVEDTIEGIYSLGQISRTTKLDAVLDFFAQDGKAKIVARPNIIVINGKTATFHSGGRLLIPTISANNVSVEEKPYGVDLTITPFGDRKSNLINTAVAIEVSTLDWANAVKSSEATIPAIKDRKISTQIDIKLGKTIVIAGLLMEEEQEFTKRVPILGHIPLLGLLFSTSEVKKSKTELVIFLTPSFVNFLGEEILE